MAKDIWQVPDAEWFARLRQQWSPKLREKLMLDLANLDDEDIAEFWERWDWLDREPDAALTELRDELRAVWGNLSAAAEIDSTLRRWIGTAKDRPAFVPYDPLNTIIPNPWNLRVTLAFAVIDNFPKLGTCLNPKCPRRYFLRPRLGQQFCTRKACLAYGQRQHRLHWWRTHRSPGGFNR